MCFHCHLLLAVKTVRPTGILFHFTRNDMVCVHACMCVRMRVNTAFTRKSGLASSLHTPMQSIHYKYLCVVRKHVPTV